jgi:glycosyltransferase involved in cell wall biosynthesis
VDAFERSIRELGLTEHVVFLGRVPQRQLGELYAKCDLMVYPSVCESFGFSMIEAVGYGVPIVAADTGVNREMCGEAALYYPPLDAECGAATVHRALDSAVSEHLRVAAHKRIQGFDWGWRRYARDFVKLIEAVT